MRDTMGEEGIMRRSRIFSYSQNKSMLLQNVDESDDGLTKL
jgi:hypothetical protein